MFNCHLTRLPLPNQVPEQISKWKNTLYKAIKNYYYNSVNFTLKFFWFIKDVIANYAAKSTFSESTLVHVSHKSSSLLDFFFLTKVGSPVKSCVFPTRFDICLPSNLISFKDKAAIAGSLFLSPESCKKPISTTTARYPLALTPLFVFQSFLKLLKFSILIILKLRMVRIEPGVQAFWSKINLHYSKI